MINDLNYVMLKRLKGTFSSPPCLTYYLHLIISPKVQQDIYDEAFNVICIKVFEKNNITFFYDQIIFKKSSNRQVKPTTLSLYEEISRDETINFITTYASLIEASLLQEINTVINNMFLQQHYV